MEPNLLNLISSKVSSSGRIDFWIQVIFLVVVFIYSFFALLIYKQVRILNQTIYTPKATLLNNFSLVHLLASIIILVAIGVLLVF